MILKIIFGLILLYLLIWLFISMLLNLIRELRNPGYHKEKYEKEKALKEIKTKNESMGYFSQESLNRLVIALIIIFTVSFLFMIKNDVKLLDENKSFLNIKKQIGGKI